MRGTAPGIRRGDDQPWAEGAWLLHSVAAGSHSEWLWFRAVVWGGAVAIIEVVVRVLEAQQVGAGIGTGLLRGAVGGVETGGLVPLSGVLGPGFGGMVARRLAGRHPSTRAALHARAVLGRMQRAGGRGVGTGASAMTPERK